MKHFLSILVFASLLSSCSQYQKVLKSEDIAAKFNLGDSLYKLEKYDKANRLFAQIVPKYKGKPQAEKLMFLYSSTFYKMEDYYVAGYQFERFTSSYPKSTKKAEAAFLAAKSQYMLSPVYSKDQKDTREALEKLQNFIDVYPQSEHMEEANTLIKELDFKLEKKAFEIAKQYNHISDYQASIKSFNNFVFQFPGSKLREDALFFRFDSAYQLAINSVEYKKSKRLKEAKDYYESFKKAYVNSKFVEDADEKAIRLDKELENYSTKS